MPEGIWWIWGGFGERVQRRYWRPRSTAASCSKMLRIYCFSASSTYVKRFLTQLTVQTSTFHPFPHGFKQFPVCISMASGYQGISVGCKPSFKKPRRVTMTIPQSLYDYLVNRSIDEGRSLSNLCSYLLETSSPGVQSIN